ncbi:6451_t:CDS:2 [Ambispora gerdemannii]|uniref:6451_t:CDS:1 n=1 Tax=Ambispora gerdemannii TaxID=144530 RepID=A0A9N9CEJ1_9GLOM|nr:6451_t:CDS:2 [Ambispora gerdemannii]
MSNLVSKIEALFLKGSLDAICSATVIYLTRKGTALQPLLLVKDLAERAVNSSLTKITDFDRRMRVLEVLPQQMLQSLFYILLVRDASPEERCCQENFLTMSKVSATPNCVQFYSGKQKYSIMEVGYKSVVRLDAVKGLKTEQEPNLDRTREEIERNIRTLKSKLGSPMTDADISLYNARKTNLRSINLSELSWRDPEANMIISDDSTLVKNLRTRQKQLFLEPLPDVLMNIVHNKEWKEEDVKLLERTNRILSVLEGVWNNPAFATSEMRSSQSEGTYITDIVVTLLRAGLDDLPNGSIEKSSHSSRVPIGKKPDVMVMEKCGGKIFELARVESSRVVCTNSKKEDDSIKLWRETLDGISLVGITCRPKSNQFGIVGIQVVAGEDLCLNVLVRDANGIPRYFHLIQAQIPFTKSTSWRVKPLIHLLLTLRNITIVNKSLLMQALKQANTRPPRNANPSPTVSSPLYD